MWFPLEFFQFHIDITFFIIAVIYLFAFIKSRMFSSLLFLWEYFQQSQAILERKKNWCHSLILGFREQSHFLQLFLKSVVHLSHMASSYIQSVSARARHDSFSHWCLLHVCRCLWLCVLTSGYRNARHSAKWKCSAPCWKILQNFKMATAEC